eukprot:GHVU01216513.1.p1 GENE.GHVU01216513.1~~GHVU01216513.1.p1  ORF type:complete len:220 (-),score=48.47 GHVU01216513.1:64-723(-)
MGSAVEPLNSEEAEMCIYRQKQVIEQLSNEIDHMRNSQAAMVRDQTDELKTFISENTHLRLQLDGFKAELAATTSSTNTADKMTQDITQSLMTAEQALSERDAELSKMRTLLEGLPRENEKLRTENQRITSEVHKLRREAEHYSKSSQMEQDTMQQRLVEVRRDLESHRNMLKDVQRKGEEARVAKRCIVQAEGDLIEYQMLVEQQREEIERLYKVVSG